MQLGALVATRGAIDMLSESGGLWPLKAIPYLNRHRHGDYGDMSPDDVQENEYSLEHGFRVMSSYPLDNGERLWIITEADRSSTTILLPSEY
jgi:hypothetical protein